MVALIDTDLHWLRMLNTFGVRSAALQYLAVVCVTSDKTISIRTVPPTCINGAYTKLSDTEPGTQYKYFRLA